jgi:hypothetical protein
MSFSCVYTVTVDTTIGIDFFISSPHIKRIALRPSFPTGETTYTFYLRQEVKRLQKTETRGAACRMFEWDY